MAPEGRSENVGGGEEGVTPNSKVETRNPPRTPYKPRRKSECRSSSDDSIRKSLTPLFSAAAKRAEMLGGRFGTISKRSKRRMDALEKKKTKNVQERRRKGEEETCSHVTVHTAPQNKERRRIMTCTQTDDE